MDNDAPPSARADLISSGVWLAIGAAISVGSWRMDRLEAQGVPVFAAPGLVPGILGLLIMAAAFMIVLRSVGRLRRGVPADSPGDVRPGIARVILTLSLCLAFAAGMVGHGLPFWMAAFIYLFIHVLVLQWPERTTRGERGKGVVVAALVAAGVSAFVVLMFQEVFLVRLP